MYTLKCHCNKCDRTWSLYIPDRKWNRYKKLKVDKECNFCGKPITSVQIKHD